ncbi:DUF2000 family protein [Photobacterium sp. CAU 1568]|uniref:DUF2000 family protein n=1 Tax=Photobacterium arenosum TaxID=2774143 RepID=A0ABR9BIU5_9GAMM|nr:DUF2000 family protein [Photobacterium arenosum]MBD8512168.1 DUF2000 family protein [Photobacterium arenosum]
MKFDTKLAIVDAEDLAIWQKLNVVSYMSSGIVAQHPDIIGASYEDANGEIYLPICIQPTIILSASRAKFSAFISRAKMHCIQPAIYIEDMFSTGHDAANREVVKRHNTHHLPLVGMAIRSEINTVDKVFKGAKLHQ